MGNGGSCAKCIPSSPETDEEPAPVPEQTSRHRSKARKWYKLRLFKKSKESSSDMQESTEEEIQELGGEDRPTLAEIHERGEDRPTVGDIQELGGENQPTLEERQELAGEDQSTLDEEQERMEEDQPTLEEKQERRGEYQSVLEEIQEQGGESPPALEERQERIGEDQPILKEKQERGKEDQPTLDERQERWGEYHSVLEEIQEEEGESQSALEEIQERMGEDQPILEKKQEREKEDQYTLDERQERWGEYKSVLEEIQEPGRESQPDLEERQERMGEDQPILEEKQERGKEEQPTLDERQEQGRKDQKDQKQREIGKPNEEIPKKQKEETQQFIMEQQGQSSGQECDVVMQDTATKKNTEHARSMENIKLCMTNEEIRHSKVIETPSKGKKGKLPYYRSLDEQSRHSTLEFRRVFTKRVKSESSSMEDFSSFRDDSQFTSLSLVSLGEYSFAGAQDLNMEIVPQDLDSAVAQVDSESAERTDKFSSGLSSMQSEYDSTYSREKDCYNTASSHITNRAASSLPPYISSLDEASPLSGSLNVDRTRGGEAVLQQQTRSQINTGSSLGAQRSILKSNKLKSIDDEGREMQIKKKQKSLSLEEPLPSHLTTKRPCGSSDNVNQGTPQTITFGSVEEIMEHQSILRPIKAKKPGVLKKTIKTIQKIKFEYPKLINPANPNPDNINFREEPLWRRRTPSSSTPQSRSHSDKEMLRRINNNQEWRESWRNLIRLPRRRLHLSWQKYKASRTRQPEQPWYIAPPVIWTRIPQPQTAGEMYPLADEAIRLIRLRRGVQEITQPLPQPEKITIEALVSSVHGYFFPYTGESSVFGYSNHSARHVRFDLEDEPDSAVPQSIATTKIVTSGSISSIPSLPRTDGEPATQDQADDMDVSQPSASTQESDMNISRPNIIITEADVHISAHDTSDHGIDTNIVPDSASIQRPDMDIPKLSSPKEATDINISTSGSVRQSTDMDTIIPCTAEGEHEDPLVSRARLSPVLRHIDSTDSSSSSVTTEKQRRALIAIYGTYEDDDDELYYPDDKNPERYGNVSI